MSKRHGIARIVLFAILAMLALGIVAVVAVPQLRWRVHVMYLHATGQIPDLEFSDLVKYMMPGADQSMTRLITTHNPYAVIQNFRTSESDINAGNALFSERCSSCHGVGGTGGSAAPAFVEHKFEHGESDWAVYRNIRYGISGSAMQGNPDFSDINLWQIVAYLRSISTPVTGDSSREAATTPDVGVPFMELRDLNASGDDWLTYSGSYTGIRHSALDQIDTENVNSLRVSWIHQFEGQPVLEVSPLVRNGVMYLSVPPCSVRALDASTGADIWTWTCKLLTDKAGEHTGGNTRGVALLDDKVFIATWDARMFAIDSATGKQLWQATVAEDFDIYHISGAPLAVRDMVVTGVSTRQVGRGFIVAFDAATGEQRWKFMAVPGPGEPGNETWAGDSWKVGGGPTWLTGSYDAEEDLLYWGVGNPKPDYDTVARQGDNLYTNSVVALRASSGELAWHFQFSPGDDHDWDSAQIPVLIEDNADGKSGKRMLWANRNGYYYVLDRRSGKFLSGTPFVKQTWNAGLDDSGRPIPLADPPSGIEGTLVYPSNTGGTNWWSPTYDPERNLMIVPILERGMVFFPSLLSWPRDTGRPFFTAVRALDALTGRLVWEYRRPPRNVDNINGGLLSSDGGVVFGSDQSTFFALDTDTGKLLWSMETGGKIIAAPITYAVDDRQMVAIATGSLILSFSLPGPDSDSGQEPDSTTAAN